MGTDRGSRDSAPHEAQQRPRKGHRAPRDVGLAARAQKLQRALAAAAREAYAEMFGYRGNHGKPFMLELRVLIEPGLPWLLSAEPSLEEQIRGAVRDMATVAEVFRPGRVYCYRCETSECSHSFPPRPSSVFGGFSSTGLPLWPELAQVLLELKHPRVDMLYEPARGDLIAAHMEGNLLKCAQLDVFGRRSKTYDILGQVVFGFLRLSPAGERAEEQQRVACTVQAVESRRLDGSPRLDLNVLGRLWDGSPIVDALSSPYQLRIRKVISGARQRVRHMVPSSRGIGKGGPPRLRSDVPDRTAQILRELARTFERLGRQKGRRTVHAEERGIGNRPTSKAWEDASAASLDRVLWDVHRHTVVVIGPRNRVHVFSPAGRHITSLLLEEEAIRSRRRRQRWRPLAGEPLEQFSAAVARKEPKAGSSESPSTHDGPAQETR